MQTIPLGRRVIPRLTISRPDGTTWEDVTDYLISARTSVGNVDNIGTGASGVDGVASTATFVLKPEGGYVDLWSRAMVLSATKTIGNSADVMANSLDPGTLLFRKVFGNPDRINRDGFALQDVKSKWNNFNGQFAPLLASRREILFEVSVDGEPYVPLFYGLLGEGLTIGQDGRATVQARDFVKLMQDTFIESVHQYGTKTGQPVEQVIQQVLDDHLGVGVVTLNCPVSPNWMVKTYNLQYKSVWDAVQELVKDFGWFLGYRRSGNAFLFTLLEPPRDKVAADYLLDHNDFFAQETTCTDQAIRNVLYLTYRDDQDNRITIQPQNCTCPGISGTHNHAELMDQTSIDVFGRRAMGIEETDTNHIKTLADALKFGAAAIHDLKDYPASYRIDMPLFFDLMLFDTVGIKNARLTGDSDTVLLQAVTSIEHSIEISEGGCKARTSVITAGRVIGGNVKWRRMETRPGAKGEPPARQVSNIVLTAPINITKPETGIETGSQNTMGYAVFNWQPATGDIIDRYELQVKRSADGWDKSTTYYSKTLNYRITAPVNNDYKLRIRGITLEQNTGLWSAEFAFRLEKDITAPTLAGGITLTPTIGGMIVSLIRSAESTDWGSVADWAGAIVYMGTTAGFTADATHQIGKGKQSSFAISGLTQGQTYYFKAQVYDTSDNISTVCPEKSAKCAQVASGDIPDGSIDLVTKIKGLLPQANLSQITDVAKLADLIITNAKLAGDIDGQTKLRAESIVSELIASDAIIGRHIAAKQITGDHIDVDTLKAHSIRTESLVLSDSVIIPTSDDTPYFLFSSDIFGGVDMGGLPNVGQYCTVGSFRFVPYQRRQYEYRTPDDLLAPLDAWTVFTYNLRIELSVNSPETQYYTHQPAPAPAIGTSYTNGFDLRVRIGNDTTGWSSNIYEHKQATGTSYVTTIRNTLLPALGISPNGFYTIYLDLAPLNLQSVDIIKSTSRNGTISAYTNNTMMIIPTVLPDPI